MIFYLSFPRRGTAHYPVALRLCWGCWCKFRSFPFPNNDNSAYYQCCYSRNLLHVLGKQVYMDGLYGYGWNFKSLTKSHGEVYNLSDPGYQWMLNLTLSTFFRHLTVGTLLKYFLFVTGPRLTKIFGPRYVVSSDVDVSRKITLGLTNRFIICIIIVLNKRSIFPC